MDDKSSDAVPLQATSHPPDKSLSMSSSSHRLSTEMATQQQLRASAPSGSSAGESVPEQLAAEDDAEAPISVTRTLTYTSCSLPAEYPAQAVHPEQSPAETTLPTNRQAEAAPTVVTDPAKVCHCLAVCCLVDRVCMILLQ